jgi:hypothetical protein
MIVEQMKNAGDVTAVGVAGATLLGWLPEIAAGFAIIWTAVRIYTHISDWRYQRKQRAKQDAL